MKKSIKTLCVLLLGALTLASCEKETGDTVTLKAKINSYTGNSKLYVDANHYTHWNNGDAVNINGTSYSVTFSGNAAQIADVTSSNDGYTAVYPASIVATPSSVTSNATNVAVLLPCVQTYAADGNGNQIIKAPMAAQTNSNTLEFTNLCSLIKVPVTNNSGVSLTLDRIIVTASDELLSGVAKINISLDTLIMQSNQQPYANRTTALTFNDAVTLTDGETGYYYVVVPPVSSGKITIDVIAHNGSTYYYSTKTKSSAILKDNTIAPTTTLTEFTSMYAAGDGTINTPYEINTLERLKVFRNYVNSGYNYYNKHIKLTADINCGSDNWIPIGCNSNTLFKGYFDGDGNEITYQISGTSSNNQGLFGGLETPGLVKNLKVAGSVNGSGQYYGGIVGYIGTTVNITNCYSSVNITSTTRSYSYLGGIAGSFRGNITYCCVSGNIQGYSKYIGGIVGENSYSSSANNCTFTGTLTTNSSYYVGTIVGYNNNATISSCYYKATNEDGYTNGDNSYKGIGSNNGTGSNDNTFRLLSGYSGDNDSVFSISDFRIAIDLLDSQYDVYKNGVLNSLPQN